MMELRYDPARLPPLRASTAAAWHHLVAARSTDPAAASALRVAAAARAALEHRWLPAIDRLLATDAMLAWTTSAPAWARGTSGAELGRAVAEQARQLAAGHRDELVADLIAALRLAATDDAAMAAFFATLGPADLLRLLTNLATVDQRAIELPLLLRERFVAAANRGDLPVGFGRDLVRSAAARQEHRRTGDAGLAVSFLVHGADLPGRLVGEAIAEAIAQELAFATRRELDASAGWTLWMAEGPTASLGLWLDFDEPYRGDDLDPLEATDPMYALLGQLARDGDAGRRTFVDPTRARYLFEQRDVLADGGRAITRAAAAAAAGPDVVAAAPGPLLDRASLVAAAFVNLFGRANAARIGRDDQASGAAAQVVGAHLYGVEHALAWDGPSDADRHTALPAPRRDDPAADTDPAGVADLAHQVAGTERRAAVFDPAALGAVLDLAARTDAGVAVLRGDLATYQRGLAAVAASRVAAGDVPPSRAAPYLQEAMQDAARLEGRFVQHIGHEAGRHGRDRDRIRSFWIEAIGTGIERASGLFGASGSAVVDTVASPIKDFADRELTDAGERADAASTTAAVLAGERLTYVWFRELHAAGVLRPSLPPGILVDGALPPYDDLVVALAAGGPPGWSVGTVLQELDDASGPGVDIDGRSVVEAMAAVQQAAYRTLGG